jgi:dipeptidyl aminopeptidase/acylaminoacyl peptidase
MAGNVKEWCFNASGDRRFILGGAWDEPVYGFTEVDARLPFDRSPSHGFRCMKSTRGEIAKAALAPVAESATDVTAAVVSEDEYRIYERLYAYDKGALNVEIESVDESSDDWVRERIGFDAAYGGERMGCHLFLPRSSSPPYQTVIYFPGSSAMHQGSSETNRFTDIQFFVKSGRALCIPVYKGTWERSTGLEDDNPEATNNYRDLIIMLSKDLGRAVDYLETRTEIDSDKIAYYGLSWGAAMGAILPALEKRIRVSVLAGGGFFREPALPECDQRTFAPRVSIPVLMLNGRYEFHFPVENSQLPMFRSLGTPEEDKRHRVFESGHQLPRKDLIKEALDWLDRYLGPVQ